MTQAQTALGIVEQDPRIGTRVAIVNMRSVTGTLFVEGDQAEVVEIQRDYGSASGFDALVRFPEDRDGRTVRRFVDPSAQADPQSYCDGMNEARAEMRAAAARKDA